MSLFIFLSVLQGIIAAALVGIVLMQRSEGGGLGMGGGGSPGGLMSARGAADFLTRTTKWLAVLFVVLAIVLAALAVRTTSGGEIDDSLKRTAPAGTVDPLAPQAQPVAPAPAQQAPAQAPANPNDPLAGVQ
jgi:preprotein translocase subunit SecG